MTLLEAASLTRIDSCYLFADFSVNLKTLEEILLSIKSRYSSELFWRIRYMLEINEENRLDFVQLMDQVFKGKRSIVPKDIVNHFTIPEAPKLPQKPIIG